MHGWKDGYWVEYMEYMYWVEYMEYMDERKMDE